MDTKRGFYIGQALRNATRGGMIWGGRCRLLNFLEGFDPVKFESPEEGGFLSLRFIVGLTSSSGTQQQQHLPRSFFSPGILLTPTHMHAWYIHKEDYKIGSRSSTLSSRFPVPCCLETMILNMPCSMQSIRCFK